LIDDRRQIEPQRIEVAWAASRRLALVRSTNPYQTSAIV
jgi:hypothetical protein